VAPFVFPSGASWRVNFFGDKNLQTSVRLSGRDGTVQFGAPKFSGYLLLTNHNHLVMVLSVMSASPNFVFRALADPTRRAIFEQLTRQGEQTVHALTRCAGVSQPAVSKHLTVLKRAKLVRHRREGRETHYQAQPDALTPMVDWLDQYGAFWRERFDRLEELLKRMEP
jgi:DNA-binding transcriptional ArsR family regulator